MGGMPPAERQARRLHHDEIADAADRGDLELPDPVQRLQQLQAQAADAGNSEGLATRNITAPIRNANVVHEIR